jgi:hypothetical protein
MNYESEIICARCTCLIISGKDHFFEVKIEARSDRSAPNLDDLAAQISDPSAGYLALIGQLRSVSNQEAMEEVAANRMIFLCLPCFRVWIEDPAGGSS